MDGYLQTALVANPVSPQPNRTSHLTKLLKPCPPSNKEFTCDNFHAVEGTYQLVHDIHFDTIAPQFSVGTRATILDVRPKQAPKSSSATSSITDSATLSTPTPASSGERMYNQEDDTNSSNTTLPPVTTTTTTTTHTPSTPLIFQQSTVNSTSLTYSVAPLDNIGITRSTALPIPNVTSRSYDSSSSTFQPDDKLTPPHSRTTPISSIPTITTNPSPANNAISTFPITGIQPSSSATPIPTSSTSFHHHHHLHHHHHHHQSNTDPTSLSSPLFALDTNASPTASSTSSQGENGSVINNTNGNGISDLSSSVSSLSALFSRRNSVRYLHSPQRKPKNNLTKTKSSFVLRMIIHDRLAQVLANRTMDDSFLFFNIGTSFLWMDAKGKPKDPLSRIVFTKAYPTCHDVNLMTKCSEHIDVIIGFSSGDCVWYDPLTSKYFRLNKDGNMKRGSVTNVKWIPGSEDLFMASFSDGSILILDKDREDQAFTPMAPSTWAEQQFHATRPHKSAKYNPVSHWSVVEKGVGTFEFSPDGIHLAIVGLDGTLRIMDYHQERLLDIFTSYYGNFLCVAWSPDGRYLLTGGQDDLVTIWGFTEKRIVARCQGHKSWVTNVAFDAYRCDDKVYRFGSVGEDCKLILWDFSFSALHRPKNKHRNTSSSPRSPKDTHRFSFIAADNMKTRTPMLSQMFDRLGTLEPTVTNDIMTNHSASHPLSTIPHSPTASPTSPIRPYLPQPVTLQKHFQQQSSQRKSQQRHHHHSFGFKKRSSSSSVSGGNQLHRPHLSPSSSPPPPSKAEYLGTAFEAYHSMMPTLHPAANKTQVPLLQPSTVRTIHGDPCVNLIFRHDSIVTTDRRGRIRTWGRP
ncbi:uncharacterized protein BX664DRAFT_338261 [Halteromyces radiatus]|uniref:uncharacterized protein n=1 Tax=Halteromyces radiatus TaxID=101107 RepID=UPI00221FA8B8|nr:uncharacterized protein BX664DRAFT_338261 [Halteromyces radiatus]KAI8084985.1 hypothetical protein BX664DRAFT_338261 [Halteromyces radiatus]